MSRRNLNYLPVLFIGLFFSFFSISNLRADVTEEQWNETLLDKAVESFDEICSENKVQNPVSGGGAKAYNQLREKMKKMLHPTSHSKNIIIKTPFQISSVNCAVRNLGEYGDCMAKSLEAYANEFAFKALSEIYGIHVKNIEIPLKPYEQDIQPPENEFFLLFPENYDKDKKE